MTDFQTRDPLSPAFWDERFEKQFTPWDQGGVPARLRRFVADSPAPLRCLIPGCGSAYELVFMLDHGWDATAIDFRQAPWRPPAPSWANGQGGWCKRISLSGTPPRRWT